MKNEHEEKPIKNDHETLLKIYKGIKKTKDLIKESPPYDIRKSKHRTKIKTLPPLNANQISRPNLDEKFLQTVNELFRWIIDCVIDRDKPPISQNNTVPELIKTVLWNIAEKKS